MVVLTAAMDIGTFGSICVLVVYWSLLEIYFSRRSSGSSGAKKRVQKKGRASGATPLALEDRPENHATNSEDDVGPTFEVMVVLGPASSQPPNDPDRSPTSSDDSCWYMPSPGGRHQKRARARSPRKTNDD